MNVQDHEALAQMKALKFLILGAVATKGDEELGKVLIAKAKFDAMLNDADCITKIGAVLFAMDTMITADTLIGETMKGLLK